MLVARYSNVLKHDPRKIQEKEYPGHGSFSEKARFLLRYAILAPSTHNTQPWNFLLEGDRIEIHADESRWLKVADPDQRELFISLGCALENILVAAEHFGLGTEVDYPGSSFGKPAARVRLKERGKASPFRSPELFAAIPSRHTNRRVFRNEPVSEIDRSALQACCVESGISLQLTGDPKIRALVDRLTQLGDAMLFSDASYREELSYWVGKGVFGHSWLISRLGELAISNINFGKSVSKKDSDLLRHALLLGFLVSSRNERASQVQSGQVFERLFLKAQSLGIRLQPMSQIIQVPELKMDLARLLPLSSGFFQQVFRLGYADPEKEQTPRRSLEEVVKSGSK